MVFGRFRATPPPSPVSVEKAKLSDEDDWSDLLDDPLKPQSSGTAASKLQITC
ncbi:unnamed protein product [Polarella glacialis]|uniref:Uncharacterized protein n=1 Tax=Polarella glacialis TaxID=89957 RepID=A0A813K569_POLGL|nr:unnamed protein product [Polarella glacialis]